MKTAGKFVGLAAIMAALFLVTPAQAQVTLRLGNIYPADHSTSKGADKLAELVAQKTNGQVKIENFHDSKLGNEREIAESVKAGSLDMCISGLAGVGRFVQTVHVLELPYLYGDLDQLHRVGQALGPDVEKLMLQAGIRTLGFFYLGPRDIAAKRPIRSLEDMKGLRFRVPESPLYVGMARALGANPTPIAFPEVYTSLQSGVAEAAEGGPDTLWANKWYEPARNIALTHHILHLFHVSINEGSFQKLTPAQRQALQAATREASAYQLELIKAFNNESLDKMKAAGATIIPITDIQPFVKALEPFDQSYAEKLGPDAVKLLQRIKEVK
jgi:tripartite ATP-independent transporter DctP family solute receptor